MDTKYALELWDNALLGPVLQVEASAEHSLPGAHNHQAPGPGAFLDLIKVLMHSSHCFRVKLEIWAIEEEEVHRALLDEDHWVLASASLLEQVIDLQGGRH